MSKPKKQNPTPAASATTNDAPDSFVPDPAVRREFGICEMTLTRWDADEDMDFLRQSKSTTGAIAAAGFWMRSRNA